MSTRTLIVAIVLASAARDATAEPPGPPTGVAVGVEAGEPSAVTARWAGAGGLVALDAGVGSGTRSGPGLYLHADVSTALAVHRGDRFVLPLHLGVGVRRYRHGFEPMSIDEVGDVHTGVYLAVGAGVALASGLELYLSHRPRWDLARSDSCTLASGADSVCPHAQSSRAFVDGVLGGRFYF